MNAPVAPDQAAGPESQDLARLAVSDPGRVLRRTQPVLAAALRARDWQTATLVSRAEGIAAKELDELARSVRAFRRSIVYARRLESVADESASRVALAGTLALQGKMTAAAAELATAATQSSGIEAAKAKAQQAALLLYLGRWDDGEAVLKSAIPALRRGSEPEWTVRALLNRSLIEIRKQSFTPAENDLRTAQQLVERHDLRAWAPYVQQNWGWLDANRGSVLTALDHYLAAEQINHELGIEVGGLSADRAHVYLSMRLLSEAREAAERAIDLHRISKRKSELSEAQLLLATVALVQGDASASASAADLAIRSFSRIDQRAGLALARHARLQARLLRNPTRVTPADARRVADELAAAGWAIPALDARVLAGRLALERGHLEQARVDLGQAAAARRSGPAEVRTRAWLAEALLREAENRRSAARSAISTGLRIVEDYQASLGATELRAHVTSHREELAAAGLRMALTDRKARRVLSFVERGRASSLRIRRPGQDTDPELTGRLAELRTVMADLEQAHSAGRSSTALVARQVALEKQVAQRFRNLPAPSGSVIGRSFDELAGSLRDAVLVEFIEQAGNLHAVTVVDGRARLVELGSLAVVGSGAVHLAFAVRRLADPATTPLSRASAALVMRRITGDWDQLLFGPLRRVIGDRPLVVVPSDTLHGVPWSMLPSCTGRPLSVVPSARLWVAAGEVPPSSGGTVVVAGPGLRGAETEAAAVAREYPAATLLTGAAASAAAVLRSLDGAGLLHVAAHGRLRSDNPFFSALLLADGPLTIYELERLGRAPHHVVLAACEAASQRVLAVDEVTGLTTALLAQGTASLLAPVMEVADSVTGDVMLDYHRALRSGRTPAEALAAAVERARSSGDEQFAAAGVFVCSGAGHSHLAR